MVPEVEEADEVAARIAAQTLARRGSDYTAEVRRLLDAALEVIAEHGTTSRARVADIVAAAGLSNDAFYRHFPSKSALVDALIEDGTHRLASYLGHQMAKESTPEGKVRRWVDGVLSQTNEQTASATLAVLLNGSSSNTDLAGGTTRPSSPLAELLHEPFVDLGSADPELHASLVTHAVLGKLADYLWSGQRPIRDEVERITQFAIGTVR
jgi:AcrR family transcriptional regulator